MIKKCNKEKKSRGSGQSSIQSTPVKHPLIIQKVKSTQMRATYPVSYHIQTGRLTLRPFETVEAMRFSQLADDSRVQDLDFNVPLPFDEAHAKKRIEDFIAWWGAGSSFTFGIRCIERRELMGGTSISVNRAHLYGELGYWLGYAYWGKGYATEAARAILGFAFDTLNLQKVCSQSLPENKGSIQILKKLGMVEEGILRQQWIKQGKRRDLIQFGLLKEEYQAVTAPN